MKGHHSRPPKKGLRPIVHRIKCTRSLLVEAIKLSTKEDVTHLANKYFHTVDKWVRAEGKRAAVVRLKLIYLTALRSMADDPVASSWIKTGKSRGFPRSFSYLESFWLKRDKSPAATQAVLSILGYYRNILAPGTPDLGPITRPGREIPESLIDEILSLGLEGLDWEIKPKRLPPVKLQIRSKQGPCGQSTLMAFKELSCLPKQLVDALLLILSKSDDEDMIKNQIPQVLNKLPKPDNTAKHSKLSIKRERGGKDRVFAMVDYWTQTALKPLHSGLGALLRQLPQDCTYDQGAGVGRLKEWTRNGSAISIDLSSATDRFPMKLLTAFMEKVTGDKDFTEAWRCLMVDRDFTYKSKTYRWAVGQPLGALSSWPSFAVAHHLVMRAAYRKAGLDPNKGNYLLLGDDMAAEYSEAIPYYLSYLDSLGVEISPTKGLRADFCEFAKRIFMKGHEVSPIPVPMIETLLTDEYLLPEFISKVSERCSVDQTDLRTSGFVESYSRLTNKDLKTLSILAEYPIPQMRYCLSTDRPSLVEGNGLMVNWAGEIFPAEEIWRVFNQVRYRYMIRQLDNLTRGARVAQQELTKLELPSTPKGIQRMHPAFYSFGNYFDEVVTAKREVQEYLTSSDGWPECPLVHTTNVTSLLKGSRKSCRHSGEILLATWSLMNPTRNEAP